MRMFTHCSTEEGRPILSIYRFIDEYFAQIYTFGINVIIQPSQFLLILYTVLLSL
jgi:hypothetical protein